MKALGTIVFLLLLTFASLGQQSISVGEQVEFSCTRVSSGWCSGRVESISGGNVKIRWGNMRDQASTVTRDKVRTIPKPDSPEVTAFKEAFAVEVDTPHRNALRIFAHYYKPDEFSNAGGTPTTPAGWQKLMADLTFVDSLCKGKYKGMANRSPSVAWPGPRKGDLDARYGEWCEIADKRLSYETQVRTDAAKHMIGFHQISDMQKAIEHSRNIVWDEEQMILYEPEKWKAKTRIQLAKSYADYGVPVPADVFTEIDAKAAELKAVIERTAPTRSFTQPAHKDAAVEAFIKPKLLAAHPGSQILRIGGSYPSWVKRESVSLVGSGTGYKLYKIEYKDYKQGYALMKMANRPFCQVRSWIAGRGAKGMVADLGEAGEFVKCP